jgi:LacI family transcriptional regulator
MSHLIDQGYQHIGHISGPLDWWEARERMAAWKDVLKEAGRDIQDRFWVEGDWSPLSGLQGLERLREQYGEMDAIFVANDQMSVGVFQLACQTGLKIPEKYGVIGFDNITESAFFWPPLSTIQQDQYKIGKIAVEEIVKIIDANWQDMSLSNQNRSCWLPLVIGQSSLRKSIKGGELEKSLSLT